MSSELPSHLLLASLRFPVARVDRRFGLPIALVAREESTQILHLLLPLQHRCSLELRREDFLFRSIQLLSYSADIQYR